MVEAFQCSADSVRPPEALAVELAHLGLSDFSDEWTALQGGRTNAVWHVTGPKGSRVVKLFRPNADTPLFRNDHGAEASVLHALAGKKLAPELVYYGITVSGPALVYRHAEGQAWRKDTDKPARLLRKLHQGTIVGELSDLCRAPRSAAELKAQTLAIIDDIPALASEELVASEPAETSQSLVGQALLHGDPVPNNFVCSEEANATDTLLIDWQCPCLGDPILDLALFLSPAMQLMTRGTSLSAAERDLFLRSYGDPVAVERLAALQPMFHWRMAAYCLWKITRDLPDLSYVAGYEAEMAALRVVTY